MAIPLAVAAGLGLTSTIGGMVQTLGGKEKQREAEKASAKYASEIENLRAKNLMEGVAIPMRGFDLAKEAQAQRYATGVAALQSAGAEGVLGGLTRLERQQGQQDLALAAQLEKMEYARNLERARQAQNIENQAIGRQAQLNFMRLQGAGQAAAEGARQQQAGIQSIIGGLGTAAELGLKYAPLYGKNKANTGSGTPGFDPSVGMTNQGYSIGTAAPWGGSGSMAMGGASTGLTVPTTTMPQGMMPQGATSNVMDTPALAGTQEYPLTSFIKPSDATFASQLAVGQLTDYEIFEPIPDSVKIQMQKNRARNPHWFGNTYGGYYDF
tara:strand:- start:2219 stop:3193 length:975 start_codon:yes stop_codon:yes gene_type:complete